MQTESGLLFSVPVTLGGTLLKGQVLAPVVALRRIQAPGKRSRNYKISLEVFIDKDDAPSLDDVAWLLPGAALRDVQVLLVFKEGTIKASADQVPS